MDYDRYMAIAIDQAKTAFDAGEFPVGCIIVYSGEVIASGFRKNTNEDDLNEVDHAEILALRELSRLKQPVDRKKAVLFCTLEPCLMCYSAIILSGIGTIVYAYEDAMGGGTSCDLSKLAPLYADAEIELVSGVLRGQSLALFKKFFENPANRYWKGSLLEAYTLSAEK